MPRPKLIAAAAVAGYLLLLAILGSDLGVMVAVPQDAAVSRTEPDFSALNSNPIVPKRLIRNIRGMTYSGPPSIDGYCVGLAATPVCIGEPFVVTAHVCLFIPGEAVTLVLPPGMELVDGGPLDRHVRRLAWNYSIVSWRVKAYDSGRIEACSRFGATASCWVTVQTRYEGDAHSITAVYPEQNRGDRPLAWSWAGRTRILVRRARIGKPFTITAYIKTIKPDEHAEIELSPGLAFAAGEEVSKPIPPPVHAGYSQVNWQVIAAESGTYPVRVTVPSIGIAGQQAQVRPRYSLE